MEIKIGITHLAREVALESNASSDDIVAQVREAVDNNTLLDLVDDQGRRVLVPGDKIGYLDLGSPSARAVGFGAV